MDPVDQDPDPQHCYILPGVQVVEKLCLAGADTTASSTGENPLWIALGQYLTITGISEGPVILRKTFVDQYWPFNLYTTHGLEFGHVPCMWFFAKEMKSVDWEDGILKRHFKSSLFRLEFFLVSTLVFHFTKCYFMSRHEFSCFLDFFV